MKKIALLTDSTCDLPNELIEKYGIKIIPLQIIYHDREYRDGEDISVQEIYENIKTEIPKTSMPSIGETLERFKGLKEEGYTDILAIHLASNLSGTFKMMESIKDQVKDMGLNLIVIDSKSISVGVGFLVLKAAELIEAKVPLAEIVEKIQKMKKEVKVFFVVKTLEYLRKGGRIGLVEGAIGDILNIKPVISVNEEGVYYTVAKVRGWNRSLNKLYDSAKEALGSKKVDLAIMQGMAKDEAQKILEKVKEEFNLSNIGEIITGHIGAGIGVHTGPGVVGIGFCPVSIA